MQDRPGRETLSQEQQPAGQALLRGHALTDNRHGLVVQGDGPQANGTAEREAVLDRPAGSGSRRGGSRWVPARGYDASDFVADLRQDCVTQYVAAKGKDAAQELRREPENAQGRGGRLRLG